MIYTLKKALLAVGAFAALGASHALAQSAAPGTPAARAGEVEFSRGVGFAQQGNEAPRALGQGLALREGDRLTTSDEGTAIVRLQDGTRMTVRPGSEIRLAQVRFEGAGAPSNNLLIQMFRGGLRAITGLISKGAPDAARIQTSTATIGIRGTDFDARLCTTDCGEQANRVPVLPKPSAVVASAKVVSLQGTLSAFDPAGQSRPLVVGGPVYPGETLQTAAASQAVLAFRDESRVTLGPATRLKVDNFVFDRANPSEGRFLVSMLQGSMRALTGLIGRANSRNVGFVTNTATVGIRGTGLDMRCADAGCSLFAWLGTIEVTPNGQTALQVLQAGEGLFVSPDGIRRIDVSPLLELQRPDGVPVDMDELFGLNNISEDQPGLFLLVRDGHLEVRTATDVLHLGRGESGFVDTGGSVGRPESVPRFLEFDLTPLPNSPNPLLQLVLQEAGVLPLNQCR